MGTSHGDFVKYPRTPHIFGSSGTDDDKHLSEKDSNTFIDDDSLIIEEKLDGTNVGLHFNNDELILQCRGHLITEGMHPQYDLFKQWANVKKDVLFNILKNKYILFGEWLYAQHTILYKSLTHYFYEFDIYDKELDLFLSLSDRMKLLKGTGICTVPVIQIGKVNKKILKSLIGPSNFDSEFIDSNGKKDNLMEGLYLRTEKDNKVSGRAKFVRKEFIDKIKSSSHWQSKSIIQNKLSSFVDIWS